MNPYEDGRNACASGVDSSSNPYIGNPLKASDWLRGWMDQYRSRTYFPDYGTLAR